MHLTNFKYISYDLGSHFIRHIKNGDQTGVFMTPYLNLQVKNYNHAKFNAFYIKKRHN